MRIYSYILLIFIFAVSFSSCEKKYFAPVVVDPNVPVSYSTEIEPIWTAKCLGSGCHAGSVPPNLTAGKSYSALIDGLYVDTLNAEASILMVKLRKDMPPGNPLPASDISKIENWMKQGAKDN